MSQLPPLESEAPAEPDIVKTILERVLVRLPGCEDSMLEIEAEIRAEFGGMRVRIPKRKKHPTASQRRQAYADGLSAMSTEEVTKRNGISRATLYDYMKRFGHEK